MFRKLPKSAIVVAIGLGPAGKHPMSKTIASFVAVLALGLTVAAGSLRAQTPGPQWLMVVQGQVTELGPGMMVIASPRKAIVFSDRPERLVKILDLHSFASAAWGEGGTLRTDPPNASIITEGGAVAIVEITDATYESGQFHLTLTVLDGTLPVVGDDVGITIDAFPTAVNDQITDA